MNAKPITLKCFPEDLYRKAKAEAAMLGVSLPEVFKRAVELYIKQNRSVKHGKERT